MRLQARTIARFADVGVVGEILVLVNSRHEPEAIQQFRKIIPEYGALAPIVRVLGGADIFHWENTDNCRIHRLRRFRTEHPVVQLVRRSGWKGNNGWMMQQAFKLASAREVAARHMVVLDAKNLFLSPISRDDYVAEDGRARTNFDKLAPRWQHWISASERALGVERRDGPPPDVIRFVTPLAFETDIVLEVLRDLERLRGPVQSVFASRFNNATEFMLISAWCEHNRGGVRQVFADGCAKSITIHSGHDDRLIEEKIGYFEDPAVKIVGLHRNFMERISRERADRLGEILAHRRAIECKAEFDDIVDSMKSPATMLGDP